MSLMRTNPSHSKSSFFQFVSCCAFLILSLTDATSEQNSICDIGLINPTTLTPDYRTMAGNGNINNRSLSPWDWIHHTDIQRIPRVLYEAKCQSHHCTYPNPDNHRDLNSVPIYMKVLVLTEDPNNRKCFKVNFQKVSVGCKCVRSKSSLVQHK